MTGNCTHVFLVDVGEEDVEVPVVLLIDWVVPVLRLNRAAIVSVRRGESENCSVLTHTYTHSRTHTFAHAYEHAKRRVTFDQHSLAADNLRSKKKTHAETEKENRLHTRERLLRRLQTKEMCKSIQTLI